MSTAADWRKAQNHSIQLKQEEHAAVCRVQELYEKVYGVKITKHNVVVEAVNILISRLESEDE